MYEGANSMSHPQQTANNEHVQYIGANVYV